MLSDLDTRPRRVWLGLTVPGKKMMRVLESRDRLLIKQSLTELYRDESHVALYSAALALHLLPRHGESHKMRYRDVLADIRDFLKFRFRAKVSTDTAKALLGDDEIMALATDGESLSHVIERVNELCRQFSDDDTAKMTELLTSMRRLRELLKNVARRLYPGGPEEYAGYEAMFAQPPQ